MSRMNEPVYREAENRLFADHGADVREHWVDVSHPRTSVRVLEIGSGKPVLFIHGSPNNAATWTSLATHMTGYRCLLVERPGAGLSKPVRKWKDHRSESVAVLDAVVNAFNLDRTDVVASSFGGLYAYNYALAHPQNVGKMVQLGAPAGPQVLGMPTIFRFLSLPIPSFVFSKAMRPDPEKVRDMFSEFGLEDEVKAGKLKEAEFHWYSSLLCNTDTLRNLLAEVRAIARPWGYRSTGKLSMDHFAAMRMPILYLWGSKDEFATAANADRLAAYSPNARIEHLESFSHLPWYNDAALVASRLTEFLESEI